MIDLFEAFVGKWGFDTVESDWQAGLDVKGPHTTQRHRGAPDRDMGWSVERKLGFLERGFPEEISQFSATEGTCAAAISQVQPAAFC